MGGIAGGALVLVILAVVLWKVVTSRKEPSSVVRNDELEDSLQYENEPDPVAATRYVTEANALDPETHLPLGHGSDDSD
jgi:hypothetical protein